MSAFPEAQVKAQAAIDELLGGDKFPDHRDIGDLPYVQAIFLEVMRWGTAAPLCGFIHLTLRLTAYLSEPANQLLHIGLCAATYIGVLESNREQLSSLTLGASFAFPPVPRAYLAPPSRGCLHDATDFPEPMKFKPERFLTPDCTKLLDKFTDPRDFAFGYGRRWLLSDYLRRATFWSHLLLITRVCPGRWMAESFLWISFVTVLATFNISKALDEQGNEIMPDLNFDSGQAAR
jgi:hypothetical protein